MTNETYIQAKEIVKLTQKLESEQRTIMKMKSRQDDSEFDYLRQISVALIGDLIKEANDKFEGL